MLTLLEEVVLLGVDERTGELTAREFWTEYALASAVLFDLALAGRIDTDTERVEIVDGAPTGMEWLDRRLEAMVQRPELETVQQWLEELVARRDDIEGEALAVLEARGILKHEKTKRLWVIDVERFPLLDPGAQDFVRQRLRRAVLSDEIPATRDIMLVSLTAACGLLGSIVSAEEMEARKARVETLCGIETISRKVAEAIGSLQAFRERMGARL